MDDKSNGKNEEMKDCDGKNRDCCRSDSIEKNTKNIVDFDKNIESPKSSEKTSFTSGHINSLLSNVEKTIKELYEAITKKISNFVANDLPSLKNLSKDELTKLNSSMSEYKMELEKLSQEKLKRIGEMKKELQTRIITMEEVRSFVKFIDDRIDSVRKITESMIKNLKQNEAANTFVKDLQKVAGDYGSKITNSMINVYNSLKEMVENVGKSDTDKEKMTMKTGKMSATSELQKKSSMLSKMLKKMGTGGTNFKDSGEMAGRILLPVTRFRNKLPILNLAKHFNSNTIHGRANVAKVTYASIILYYLYWKMTKARS